MLVVPTHVQAIHIPEFTPTLNAIKPTAVPLNYDPESELLIRTSHVSPTHVDILYTRGQHQNNRTIAKPPFILGTDFAGTIVATPPGYSKFKLGDQVYGSYFGVFATYVAVNPGLGSIRLIPSQWSPAQACAVGSSGAISLGAFLRAGPLPHGSWALVTGATGGLGVQAVQVARALGLKVIALVGSEPGKAEMLKSIGAEATVLYQKDDWEKDVHRITGGQGVSVVYDAVGLVEKGLRCCGFGGTVVVVGFAGRGGQMELLKVNRVLLKGAGVIGYVSGIRLYTRYV
jgi:NADPH:quinone reductase-like Zn-dependent oxidoreductase